MKRLVALLAGIAGLCLVLLVGSGLLLKALLSGGRLQGFLESLGTRLPVPVTMGQGDFDLGAWLRFQPAFTISGLKVGNPEGFSAEPMLEAHEVSAQFRLMSIFEDRLEIGTIDLREPVLTIERGPRGTNVEVLLAALAAATQAEAETAQGPHRAGRGISIISLSADSGTVRYKSQGTPPVSVHDIDLMLTDFASDRTCGLELTARLFNGRNSVASFAGRAGPFGQKALPAGGEMKLEVAPEEIPPQLRAEYLGNRLREPGGSSRLSFAARMEGDLLGVFQGTGKLALKDLQLGRDAEHRIALSGEAPLRMTVRRLLTRPSFELLVRRAGLNFGEGLWQGDWTVLWANKRFQGASVGSVTNVRIDQVLDAFTITEETIFGRGEIPAYKLSYSGGNAAEMQDSLAGSGKLTLQEGRIGLFNLVDTIERHARKLLAGETVAHGSTEFQQFTTDFEIRDRQIILSGARLESQSSAVTGGGIITFDKTLNLDLMATVTGEVARLLGGRPDASGQPVASIPVKVRGTVEDPQVRPDIGNVVVRGAVGILERLLKRTHPEEEKTPPQP